MLLVVSLAACATNEARVVRMSADGAFEDAALAGRSQDPARSGQEPEREQPRWHPPRRNARTEPRVAPHAAGDWNPVSLPARRVKDALAPYGVHYDLDVAIQGQRASDTDTGKRTFGSLVWELTGDWKVVSSPELGDGVVTWNLFGGGGLNYDADSQTLAGNVGASTGLTFDTALADPVIIDELFWQQSMKDGEVVLTGGKVDMSYHFDTNRVANTPFTQFNSFALINNPAIPFPAYGGFGGILRTELTDDVYVMAGMGDSSQTVAVAPWSTTDNDSWYQLFEAGAVLRIPDLGKGTYRLIPWHNELFDETGWGLGLSVDQELGSESLLGFLRYGTADEDVSPVESFLSGGLSYTGPFDREKDTVALGYARSDTSQGARTETLVEAYYQFQLTPTLLFAPNFQAFFDPAFANDGDTVVIGGLRLTLRL